MVDDHRTGEAARAVEAQRTRAGESQASRIGDGARETSDAADRAIDADRAHAHAGTEIKRAERERTDVVGVLAERDIGGQHDRIIEDETVITTTGRDPSARIDGQRARAEGGVVIDRQLAGVDDDTAAERTGAAERQVARAVLSNGETFSVVRDRGEPETGSDIDRKRGGERQQAADAPGGGGVDECAAAHDDVAVGRGAQVQGRIGPHDNGVAARACSVRVKNLHRDRAGRRLDQEVARKRSVRLITQIHRAGRGIAVDERRVAGAGELAGIIELELRAVQIDRAPRRGEYDFQPSGGGVKGLRTGILQRAAVEGDILGSSRITKITSDVGGRIISIKGQDALVDEDTPGEGVGAGKIERARAGLGEARPGCGVADDSGDIQRIVSGVGADDDVRTGQPEQGAGAADCSRVRRTDGTARDEDTRGRDGEGGTYAERGGSTRELDAVDGDRHALGHGTGRAAGGVDLIDVRSGECRRRCGDGGRARIRAVDGSTHKAGRIIPGVIGSATGVEEVSRPGRGVHASGRSADEAAGCRERSELKDVRRAVRATRGNKETSGPEGARRQRSERQAAVAGGGAIGRLYGAVATEEGKRAERLHGRSGSEVEIKQAAAGVGRAKGEGRQRGVVEGRTASDDDRSAVDGDGTRAAKGSRATGRAEGEHPYPVLRECTGGARITAGDDEVTRAADGQCVRGASQARERRRVRDRRGRETVVRVDRAGTGKRRRAERQAGGTGVDQVAEIRGERDGSERKRAERLRDARTQRQTIRHDGRARAHGGVEREIQPGIIGQDERGTGAAQRQRTRAERGGVGRGAQRAGGERDRAVQRVDRVEREDAGARLGEGRAGDHRADRGVAHGVDGGARVERERIGPRDSEARGAEIKSADGDALLQSRRARESGEVGRVGGRESRRRCRVGTRGRRA